MLIYEVNLSVNQEVANDFKKWLSIHIPEVVKVGQFESAEWFSRRSEDEGSQTTDQVLWTIQYRVKDRKTLETYLEKQAPRLRQEGLDRFGNQFKATRRILETKKF